MPFTHVPQPRAAAPPRPRQHPAHAAPERRAVRLGRSCLARRCARSCPPARLAPRPQQGHQQGHLLGGAGFHGVPQQSEDEVWLAAAGKLLRATPNPLCRRRVFRAPLPVPVLLGDRQRSCGHSLRPTIPRAASVSRRIRSVSLLRAEYRRRSARNSALWSSASFTSLFRSSSEASSCRLAARASSLWRAQLAHRSCSASARSSSSCFLVMPRPCSPPRPGRRCRRSRRLPSREGRTAL